MREYELLEKRVSALEQEVEGEKLVTRHILEQTRRNSDDLAIIKARLNAHDHRFDRLEADIRRIDDSLTGLRRDLPTIVAETMREVLKERDR
jgi:hypothetical protein